MTTYLIIGNGVAGNAAAENIRKHDPEGKIVVFSRESWPFYYVPALPSFLAGDKAVDQIILHHQSWYDQHRIDLYLDTRVTQIDAAQKFVETDKGERFPFDKLLLATGGNSFVPPIPGADSAGVFTLRTLADADRIRQAAAGAQTAVLIGGGLLGLEAGNGLRQMGLKVFVVEFFPRLLPRQMDAAGAAILARQMGDMGFTFHLGAKTQEIAPGPDGLTVNLEGGEKLKGDLVLISAGVRPDLSLAQALGLDIDKGVKVDDAMKTSREGIYAAGDLIEHRGRFYGIWPAAMAQGAVAGAAMAGQAAKYEGTLPSNVLKVVGIDLMAAGDIDADGKLSAVVHTDSAKKTYRKLVIRDNLLVGAILLGDIRGSAEIQAAINKKTDISLLKGELAQADFDFKRLK
ncbi:MAG: NAD(P)/FAD-dependent oxidoreductase [Deltaproteobacteria bacterium CG07_land_8_20_14_0_80_60_11]|nr:MAG: NAD(P)/FAD-dependent oxidoreductase [Deltaproteobacteria bacterium CG07_land_8_20_14_0_80_60_11]